MGSAPPVKTFPASFFPRRTKGPAPRGRFASKKAVGSGAPHALRPEDGVEGGSPPITVSPSRGDRPLAGTTEEDKTMTAIGYVTKNDNGSYKGQLKTVSIRADIDIIPNRDKSAETQPDFRVFTQGAKIGRAGAPAENSRKDYVSPSTAAADLAPRQAPSPSRRCFRPGRRQCVYTDL
jgi:uncharacterized protein (DUF736 family)